MINLKSAYGHTYKVTLDPSARVLGQTQNERAWLQQIPAVHGHIYIHGENRLGAWCGSPRVACKLVRLPGVTVHQRGDGEATVTFHPRDLPAVATLLQCRRRRKVSEATLARLRAMAAARRDQVAA